MAKRWNCCECPYCGCTLDFGERCDCLDELEAKSKEVKSMLDYSEPQLRFAFAVEYEEREVKTA